MPPCCVISGASGTALPSSSGRSRSAVTSLLCSASKLTEPFMASASCITRRICGSPPIISSEAGGHFIPIGRMVMRRQSVQCAPTSIAPQVSSPKPTRLSNSSRSLTASASTRAGRFCDKMSFRFSRPFSPSEVFQNRSESLKKPSVATGAENKATEFDDPSASASASSRRELIRSVLRSARIICRRSSSSMSWSTSMSIRPESVARGVRNWCAIVERKRVRTSSAVCARPLSTSSSRVNLSSSRTRRSALSWRALTWRSVLRLSVMSRTVPRMLFASPVSPLLRRMYHWSQRTPFVGWFMRWANS